MVRPLRLFLVAVIILAFNVAAPSASAEARSCKPVVNPYAGTRYEGIDLSRIRARNVSCTTARRVARGAHFKALGTPPPVSGVRQFRWRRWNITGDLSGRTDTYTAKSRGGKRISWMF